MVLYVGKATNLHSRVNSYFRGRKTKGSRLNELLSRAQDIKFIEVDSPLEASILEHSLIKKIDPAYNRALRSSQRELNYYNSDLELSSDSYLYGPFVSQSRVEDFKLLIEAITGHNLEYFLRYEQIEESVVLEAIEEWKSYFDMEEGMGFLEEFVSLSIKTGLTTIEKISKRPT